MATRNTDVNLIIRARNEAGQAITSVAEALKTLVGDAADAGESTGSLAERIAKLDKTYADLASRTEAVRQATARQAQDLHASNSGIQERTALLATLRDGLATMQAQTDKAFVGPRDPNLPKQIKLTQTRIAELERDLGKMGRTFDSSLGGVRAGRSTLLDLSEATAAVAEAQDAAKTKLAEMTNAIREQTEAAQAAARVSPIQQRINTVTGVDRTPKSAQASAGVFAAANDDLDSQARQLRAVLDPLAAIQDRYNTSLARYRILAAQGKISTDELAAAEKHLATEADTARKRLEQSNKPSLFGLKPYELQNLSYQINDVVTGIASGQKLTQILAQQGGQILQIFPKAGGAILGALTNPGVLAGVAAMGVLAVTIGRAADNAERLRQNTAQLDFRANGSLYDARSLSEQQHGFELLGASAKDAQGAIRAFLDNGVAPDKINQFAQATKATAEILGTDMPTAANDVARAFTGGYQAIAEFDDKLNFLTGTQREHIRTLFEQGKAEEARTEALNIYSQKAQETADKQRGPWTDAARGLKRAWDSLVESLSNTDFAKGVEGALEGIANKANQLAGAFDEITKARNQQALQGFQSDIAAFKAHLAELETLTDKGPESIYTGEKRQTQQKLDEAIKGYNDLIKSIGGAPLDAQGNPTKVAPKPVAKPTGDTRTDDPNSPEAKRRADRLDDISIERELEELRRKGEKGLTDADSKRREYLAGELAYRREIKSTGDSIIATAERNKAVSTETLQVNQQNAAAAERAANKRKQDAREQEQAIRRFEQRIVGAEGGNAKNAAGSGAAGYGQFTPDTYLKYYERVYGVKATPQNRAQILETRFQKQIADAIIDAFTRDNVSVLKGRNLPVNGANLYTLHLFGNTPLGRAALGNDDVPIDQLVNRYGGKNAGDILSKNGGYLRTERGQGRYRTAKELRTFLGAKTGDISTDDTAGSPQSQGVVALDKLLEEAQQKQDGFNLAVKEGNDERQRSIAVLKSEVGLTGTRLLDAERQAAVDKAEFDLRKRVADANKNREPGAPEVTVSDAQVAETRRAAGALHDVENAATRARAKLDEVQRPSDELRDQIELLRQQAEFLRSIGENKAADAVDKQIEALQPKLDAAIDKLIEFYKALSPEERAQLGIVDDRQLDNIIAKLELAKQTTHEWGKIAGVSAKEIAQAFASSAANAFTNFLKNVAQGKNVFKSLGEAVLSFASDFAMAVAQMILQLLAYAAVVAILKALGVSVPSGGGGFAGIFGGGGGDTASQNHSGGIAGQMGGQSRAVPFDLFAGARRYHTGGIAGLKPDEVGAVLRKGEEVLTEDDPRHRNNQGGLQPDPSGVTVIPVFSMDDAFQQALNSPKGQQVFIRHVTENSGAINAALGRR